MRPSLFTGKLKCPQLISALEYADRRSQLVDLLRAGKSPFVLLRSNYKSFSAPDVPHVFRQCSHFRYLTGCLEPNSFLVINENRSILFAHAKTKHETLWEGEGPSFEELKTQANLDEVLDLTELPNYLVSELKPNSLLAADTRRFADPNIQELVDKFPGQRTHLFQALDQCRWIKSQAEIEHMKHAAIIGSEAMNSVIQRASDIDNESIFVGMLELEVRLRSADSLAYPPVVASGNRANTIHYINSNQKIEPGSCILIDAGADYKGYVSDITRSFPNQRFSNAQRELYEALDEIHQSCLDYVMNIRPLKLNELYFHMIGTMAEKLTSMVFFTRTLNEEEAIRAVEKLCEHHVSHYLGMDVHDSPTMSRSIEIPPNVVITVEPGIYVQKNNPLVRNEFKGVGFRIEDDIRITETGCEVLTESCVRSADSIESLMSNYAMK